MQDLKEQIDLTPIATPYCHYYGWQWHVGQKKKVKTGFLDIFMALKVFAIL